MIRPFTPGRRYQKLSVRPVPFRHVQPSLPEFVPQRRRLVPLLLFGRQVRLRARHGRVVVVLLVGRGRRARARGRFRGAGASSSDDADDGDAPAPAARRAGKALGTLGSLGAAGLAAAELAEDGVQARARAVWSVDDRRDASIRRSPAATRRSR